MDAPKRPRTEDLKLCAGCGKTTHHARRREEDPWTCLFCGMVKDGKKEQREKRDKVACANMAGDKPPAGSLTQHSRESAMR